MIKQLYTDGVTKSSAILAALQKRGRREPPIDSLQSYLKCHRAKIFGKPTASSSDLQQWVDGRLLQPGDPGTAHVIDHELEAELQSEPMTPQNCCLCFTLLHRQQT